MQYEKTPQKRELFDMLLGLYQNQEDTMGKNNKPMADRNSFHPYVQWKSIKSKVFFPIDYWFLGSMFYLVKGSYT